MSELRSAALLAEARRSQMHSDAMTVDLVNQQREGR